jgi:hypothetical protein
MTKRRRQLLLRVGIPLIVLLAGSVVFWSWSRPQTPVFRLREVTAHRLTGAQRVSGEHMVQAEFDYVGSPVTPAGVGVTRRTLGRLGVGRPPVPRWLIEDVVLLDGDGRELCLLPASGSSVPATRPAVRLGLGEDSDRGRVYILWSFDLPAHLKPAGPITFRTRAGLNDFAPVPIEVVLPPGNEPSVKLGATTSPTARPATSPVSSR